ncbi:MAG: repair protein RadA [Rickettsiales bacterium]|jgi:DNA repair protein RadA/Sms|nr:repair protein RadA [Rickettsiales bacterium]
MAKHKTHYACQACGSVFRKWSGRCDGCGEWDTIIEEAPSHNYTALTPGTAKSKGNTITFADLAGTSETTPRLETGISELDRVAGGGLVKGSAVLIGGDPGIGKSTLLLQAVVSLAKGGASCVYISGEESVAQVRLRAKRMGLDDASVKLASATSVTDIAATLNNSNAPDVLVIDSIQTMFVDSVTSAPGTVSQVRTAAHELIRLAKERGSVLLLVGHVTKDGQIAGPKLLEHMVDTVLYFEGDRGHQFRILRAVKNRFGAANEIGVFEMKGEGLMEVKNPSSLFLSERERNVSGSSVFAGMEGSRPIFMEIQALVSPSLMPMPRRAVVGWDPNRLAMVLAVLQTRYGINLSDKEVYLNVAGGLRVTEPGADLAVAASLLSAVTDTPLPEGLVLFGEIGLSGEIRRVGQADIRLKEAAKLGFTRAMIPGGKEGAKESVKGLTLETLAHIRQLKDMFGR